MTSNSTVVPLCQSDAIDDPLIAILRSGARRLLAQQFQQEIVPGKQTLDRWRTRRERGTTELHPVSVDTTLSRREPRGAV